MEQEHGGRIYFIVGKCVRRVHDGMDQQKYCTGFMCVGCKLHPSGKELHTISCELTSILFRYFIVEGKDQLKELGQKKYSELGKTVGMMLQMCNTLYGVRKSEVMDIGFCVSRGIF